MSMIVWRGDAPAVADVWTAVLSGDTSGAIFTITCNGKSVSFTSIGGGDAASAAALQVLLSAATMPEFVEYTWSVVSATITATANTAGIPGTFTQSTGGSGSPVITLTNVTPASGPNFWDLATNWVGGVAPATGDDVIFTGNSPALYVNQNALPTVVTPASITTDQGWSGSLGLPTVNATSTSGTFYAEYRPLRVQYCQSADSTNTLVTINSPSSGRMRLDFGSGQVTLSVQAAGNSPDPGLPCLRWIGTATTNTMNAASGTIGVAVEPGEAANLGAFGMSPITSNSNTDPNVTLGTGTTMTASTTAEVLGGSLTIADVEMHNINQTGGTITNSGTAIVNGTLNIDGGTFFYGSNGTLTTLKVGPNGTFDCSRDTRARTVTNATVASGGTVNDSGSSVTWTNNIILAECGIEDVNLKLGKNLTIAV